MSYRMLCRLCLSGLVSGLVACSSNSNTGNASLDMHGADKEPGNGSNNDTPGASGANGVGGAGFSVVDPNLVPSVGGTQSQANPGNTGATGNGTASTIVTAYSTGGARSMATGGASFNSAALGGATSIASGSATGGTKASNEGSSGDAGALDAPDATVTVDQCGLLDASKPLQVYLSADDSNSMASPVIARSIINQGGVPPAWAMRTYEFLNYYDLGYERAAAGQLAINLEMVNGDGQGTYALQIGVSSEAAAYVRRPMNITFVLDTSGSMGGVPIARSQAALKAIAASLKQGDIVSAVTWSDTNTVVMDSQMVSGPNDAQVVAMADAMQANGSTNLNAGLARGYELAQKNFVASHLNRVVLISDGQANTGVTDENIIAQGASLNDGDGIYLVGVGVGDGVNDTLMNTVTDKGRGAYVYLDSAEEANHMFVARFDETMDVAARAVQVRLDLPWYLGVARFYGEQISTNPQAVEPQHLAPNDAMVFDQILRPCSDERFVQDDPVSVTATWVTPTTHEQRTTSTSTTLGAMLASSAVHIPKGMAIVSFAEALKAGSTKAALAVARIKLDAALAFKSDADLAEIDGLLKKLEGLAN